MDLTEQMRKMKPGEVLVIPSMPIFVDYRPFPGQKKRVLDPWDTLIPKRAEMTSHIIKSLDGIDRKIFMVPKSWRNVFVKLDYQEDPVQLRFDARGYSYVEVKAREADHMARVYFKDNWGETLELLEKAKDFCDYCNHPLKVFDRHTHPDGYLCYMDGGEAIAALHSCPSCESENIRWDRDFLNWHPHLLKALKAVGYKTMR